MAKGGGQNQKQQGGGDETEARGMVKRYLEKFLGTILTPFMAILPQNYLNELLSAFDSWIDSSAEEAAKAFQVWIDKVPILRTKFIGGGFFGIISASIEELADQFTNKPAKAFIRKAADWFKTFGKALREGESSEEGKEIAAALANTFAKMDDSFGKYAGDLIQSADPAQKEARRAQVLYDAETHHEVKNRMLHGPKKPEKEKGADVPLTEHLANAVKAVDDFAQEVGNQLRPAVAARQVVHQSAKAARAQRRALQNPVVRTLDKMCKFLGL